VKALKTLGFTAIFVASIMFVGCGGGVDYYAGVSYGPPAPLVEGPIGVAPGPDYIWTPGFYDWYGGAWVWRQGEWRHRPHAEDRWVAPHGEQHGRGYVYHSGGWQHGEHFHH
jgi:hypothetical protein